MWEEIRRIDKRERVVSRDIHGAIGSSTGYLRKETMLGHFRIRGVVYVLFMILCGLFCMGAVGLFFKETYLGGAAAFIVFAGLFLWSANMMGIDGDLLRFYRAVAIGFDNNHLGDKMKSINIRLRNSIDESVKSTGPDWKSTDATNALIHKCQNSTSTLDNIHNGISSEIQMDHFDRLFETHLKVYSTVTDNYCELLLDIDALKAKQRKTNMEMDELSKDLSQEKEQLRCQYTEVGLLQKSLREEMQLKEKFQKQDREAADACKNLSEKLKDERARFEKHEKRLLADNDRINVRLEGEKLDHITTRDNFLSSTTAHDLIHHLTEWLSKPATADIKFSDTEKQKVAIMYAAMHEFLPDKERIKELALVPHETLRAQQVETIVSHYSSLIMKADKDETLSDDEREDKMNAYRMARESELQAFHGGG